MARAVDLQARHNHWKSHVAGINFPADLADYESYRQVVQIGQKRAYEIFWFSEDQQNPPPEWSEVENLWDAYAQLTARDPELLLEYDTQKRKYVCDGIDLGDTLGRSKVLLSTWIADLQQAAQALQEPPK